MTLADISTLIQNDPVTGWLFVLAALIFAAGPVGLLVALFWMALKSGRRAAFGAAGLLLASALSLHFRAPDRQGQLLALGLGICAVVFLFIGLYLGDRPDPTPQDLQRQLDKETRSALQSASGRIITLLAAGACFAAAWAVKSEKPTEASNTVMLGLCLLGCAGLFAFIFPARAASLLETISRTFPSRRRY